MDASLKFLGKDVFEEKVRAKQDEIAVAAADAGRNLTQTMAELSQLQQAEILRLQTILRDSVTVPERYPVQVAIHAGADKNGFAQHSLVAVASDRSVWVMPNFKPGAGRYAAKWQKVAGLPQVADEVDDAG
jgi:hypothetical protein